MRLGILLGFLIGAAVASRLLTSESGEPAKLDEVIQPDELLEQGEGFVAKVKRQANEARDAARQASEEKEAEMLREWEAARHGQAPHTEA